jgi:hypothetical protein
MSERSPHSPTSDLPTDNQPDPKPLEWLRNNSVPILGLLIIVLSFCLFEHYSSIKTDWATTHDFTGSIQDVVQVLASSLVVGGPISTSSRVAHFRKV